MADSHRKLGAFDHCIITMFIAESHCAGSTVRRDIGMTQPHADRFIQHFILFQFWNFLLNKIELLGRDQNGSCSLHGMIPPRLTLFPGNCFFRRQRDILGGKTHDLL